MKVRILSLILAGILLMLPACQQQPEQNDDSSASDSTSIPVSSDDAESETVPEEETFDFGYIPDGLPESMNFEGASFNIGLRAWESAPLSSVSSDELNSTPVNDSVFNASRAIESRFGCKINNVEVTTDVWGLQDEIRKLSASNDTYYSIFVDMAIMMAQGLTDGLYCNLYNVPQFDFTQPWWTNGTAALSVGDRAYLGASYLTYNSMEEADILFVNKEMATRNSITVPYEDVFNGTWTIDKLYTLASQATGELNGDGIMDENDMYGFSYMDDFLKQWQCALGVHLITKDENNLPVPNLDPAPAVQYLSFMEKLQNYTGMVPSGTPEGHTAYFSKGQVLFLDGPVSCVYKLLETDILYGFLPIPKLTEDQAEYETYAASTVWTIPTTGYSNLEFIGTIAEALNAVHFNDVRPVYFESTMKGRLSESPEDAQVLDIISRALYADFGFDFSQTIKPIYNLRDLWASSTGNGRIYADNVSSTYKSVEKNMNNYVNKLFLGKFNKLVASEEKAAK